VGGKKRCSKEKALNFRGKRLNFRTPRILEKKKILGGELDRTKPSPEERPGGEGAGIQIAGRTERLPGLVLKGTQTYKGGRKCTETAATAY